MLGRNSNRKQISLAVKDVPLTCTQTVNNCNTFFTSVASDLVGTWSNNNNGPYGDINLNAHVLWEASEDIVQKILRSFEDKKYHRDEIQLSILVNVSDDILPALSNYLLSACNHTFIPSVKKTVMFVYFWSILRIWW